MFKLITKICQYLIGIFRAVLTTPAGAGVKSKFVYVWTNTTAIPNKVKQAVNLPVDPTKVTVSHFEQALQPRLWSLGEIWNFLKIVCTWEIGVEIGSALYDWATSSNSDEITSAIAEAKSSGLPNRDVDQLLQLAMSSRHGDILNQESHQKLGGDPVINVINRAPATCSDGDLSRYKEVRDALLWLSRFWNTNVDGVLQCITHIEKIRINSGIVRRVRDLYDI